ncbi:hypothetical protein Bhyg_15027 [Pseudolycoriella hygida]|uniref:Hemolymph juvenile hormone binding protein n=1 Tax=Pseudolycoriella hygida TaxID=35572 RepID=A0A9Q0MR25_9DIPT|nr:hypothetical protein Bhyg_15027 [Pseudolycoriella hygida]
MSKALGILVLSLAVCSVTSLSVNPQVVAINEFETNSVIDDSLRNLLESLRYSLRCGFPDQGIPSLAPFYLKYAELNERGLLYRVQGDIRDLTIAGLDGYTVDIATLNILTLRTTIGLTLPKLSLSSFYNFDALLLRFIPIFGHGRLNLDVNDLSVVANARLTISLRTGRLNMTSLDIDVNMGSTFSDSTGVYDSRIVSTLFNIAFERTLRDVFDNNKENLETFLENLLIPLANGYLNELTLQDLLGLIGGGSGGSGRSDGPHLDPDTGELICSSDEEPPSETTESVSSTVPGDENTENPDTSSASDETSQSVNPTSPSTETSQSVDPPTLPIESSTDNELESDGIYDSNNLDLKNTIMKILRKAFKDM